MARSVFGHHGSGSPPQKHQTTQANEAWGDRLGNPMNHYAAKIRLTLNKLPYLSISSHYSYAPLLDRIRVVALSLNP